MTVKRYGRGPGNAAIGKPAVHPATVDLKGKAYEYVNNTTFYLFTSEASEEIELSWLKSRQ